MKQLVATRSRLLLIGAFLLAFVVVLTFSTWVLYRRAQQHLDTALGERLRSIAVTLAHAVEVTAPHLPEAEPVDPALYTLLLTAQTDNLLSNVVLVTADGNTILDLANVSAVGEPNPFIELDYTAVTLARSGLSAATTLYQSGDDYMKGAYAPVVSENNEIIGLLGVEAGATYFDVLRALRSAIIAVDVSSALLILMLGALFYRQSASLDRAQAAVAQAENLATMGRMVAGIAHEIRNPLSIIKTSAERLSRKHPTEQEVLGYISEEVDKLDEIVTGYLGFARAERRPHGPRVLQRIITRSLSILEPDIKSANVNVERSLPEEDVVVSGDDNRLQQALLNIVLNAVQAAPGGTVEISLVPRSGSAIVVVSDNGVGVADRQMKDLIRPFFTTKDKGSGLGLSIVATIVEEHNGRMDIQSRAGGGTEVTLSLPLAQS
jgi:signal transduction histidine kinase